MQGTVVGWGRSWRGCVDSRRAQSGAGSPGTPRPHAHGVVLGWVWAMRHHPKQSWAPAPRGWWPQGFLCGSFQLLLTFPGLLEMIWGGERWGGSQHHFRHQPRAHQTPLHVSIQGTAPMPPAAASGNSAASYGKKKKDPEQGRGGNPQREKFPEQGARHDPEGSASSPVTGPRGTS